MEAVGVQPRPWVCGAPLGACGDRAGVGHCALTCQPVLQLCNLCFVAKRQIKKTNQTSMGCCGRGLKHLCWFKSALAIFCIAQAGCKDCPAVNESHQRALNNFLIAQTPTLTFSDISGVNCPK